MTAIVKELENLQNNGYTFWHIAKELEYRGILSDEIRQMGLKIKNKLFEEDCLQKYTDEQLKEMCEILIDNEYQKMEERI